MSSTVQQGLLDGQVKLVGTYICEPSKKRGDSLPWQNPLTGKFIEKKNKFQYNWNKWKRILVYICSEIFSISSYTFSWVFQTEGIQQSFSFTYALFREIPGNTTQIRFSSKESQSLFKMSYSNLAAYITLSFQWGGGVSLAPQDSYPPPPPPPKVRPSI